MNHSYRFFENKECKYFPCHEGLEDFNCLFCYCPLYTKEHCPGNPQYIEAEDKKIKDYRDKQAQIWIVSQEYLPDKKYAVKYMDSVSGSLTRESVMEIYYNELLKQVQKAQTIEELEEETLLPEGMEKEKPVCSNQWRKMVTTSIISAHIRTFQILHFQKRCALK